MARVLDISTLLIVGMLAAIAAGTALGAVWLADRRERSVGVFALSLWIGAVAAALFVAETYVPDIPFAVVGSATLALAYGFAWQGFQLFDGRRRSTLKVAVGALAWLPFLAMPFLRDLPWLLASATSLIIALYSFAIVWRLYAGGRVEPLPARLPAGILFALHGALHAARVPLLVVVPAPSLDSGYSWLFKAATLEGLLLALLMVMSVMALLSQRASRLNHRNAERDALTSLPNRRAFFSAIGPLIEQSGGQGVLLLLELDHLRALAERYGGYASDRALRAFVEAVRSEVTPPDVFARVGEEEFALFMADVGLDSGVSVAEYLCRKVEALKVQVGDDRMPLTVSIGVAAVAEAGPDVEEMQAAGEQALANARRLGRNRVAAYRNAPHLALVFDTWMKAS